MYRSLLDALRKGGFILYARHGEAAVGSDLPHVNLQDCLTQRNLSVTGRKQAIYYGDMLRSLQIPIEYPVVASPFCRTIETAQLAFGGSNVYIDPFWVEIYRLSGSLPDEDRRRILNHLQSVLETIPEEGRNKVIVAHSFPEGMGLGPIPNMGTVIVKPGGPGNGFEVVHQFSLPEVGF
ncbi:histidine phosphatase family protein [Alteribacillus sp. HJP-4]|uniref:histidine phosphatase family protein n=1 Tax=Alteribacillus sp. HJP-4 TaxID=2775394 RepID=UPI0035CCEB05